MTNPDITFTDAQARQLHIRRMQGWSIEITSLDQDTHWLRVRGIDDAGCAFTGVLDARGTLVGEASDPSLRPSKFAVAL